MLVVVVVVFATLWLPYRGLVVYNSIVEHRWMELWYLLFAKTLIFVNSAINPILYSALSHKFRRAFRKMLACDGGMSNRKRAVESPLTATHFSVSSRPNDTGNKSIMVDL